MSDTTKALNELVDKWVQKDHPEKMPGLEVCIYEASLINGLDWAAEEGAETLAQLRADLERIYKLVGEKERLIRDMRSAHPEWWR